MERNTSRTDKTSFSVAGSVQMKGKMLKYTSILHDVIKHQLHGRLTTFIPENPLDNKIVVSVELLPLWEQVGLQIIFKAGLKPEIGLVLFLLVSSIFLQ